MDLLDFTPKTDDIVVELKIGDTVLVNPDGSTMTITIMSPFSPEAKAVTHAMTDERVKRKKKEALTSAEVEDLNLEGMVRTTKDWNITWAGEQPNFSQALAKEVYSKAFWIKSLIDDAKVDTLDFMKP